MAARSISTAIDRLARRCVFTAGANVERQRRLMVAGALPLIMVRSAGGGNIKLLVKAPVGNTRGCHVPSPPDSKHACSRGYSTVRLVCILAGLPEILGGSQGESL